jgi:hypothetical protein
MLSAALETAAVIENPDDRARALGKLVFHVVAEERLDVLRQALSAVRAIPDERLRARALLALRSILLSFPVLAPEVDEAVREIRDPFKRAAARDQHGLWLAAHHGALSATVENAAHHWTPVVLKALLEDVLTLFGHTTSTEQLWARLATGPSDETLDALREIGGTNRLILTCTAALTMDRLLEGAYSAQARMLLPLLTRPEPETMPLLRQWLRDEDETTRSYAALLIAETEGISVETVHGVVFLLRTHNDIGRHRAARVIHHPALVSNPTRLVSAIGRSTIDELFRVALEFRDDLFYGSLRIQWMMSDLIFDSPQAIVDWAAAIDIGGQDADPAEMVISHIVSVTPACWRALLEVLRSASSSVRTRSAVLRTVCLLANLDRISDEQWQAFFEVAHTLDQSGLDGRRVLLGSNDQLEFSGFALALMREHRDVDPALFPAITEQALRERYTTRMAEVLNLELEQMRAEMKRIGSLIYVKNHDYFEEALTAVKPIREDPGLFPLLLAWLVHLLQEDVQDGDSHYSIRYRLLVMTAAAAEQAPLAFVDALDAGDAVDTFVLERLLMVAARRHDSYPGRRAAVTLLGSLPQVGSGAAEAIQLAMLDVDDVQRGALDAARRFQGREISSLLPELERGLYHQSALAAFTASRILETLALSEHARPEQRREVLNLLAQAIRDPRSRRYVHFYYVDAKLPNMPRLDQAFYNAMMRIAGMR